MDSINFEFVERATSDICGLIKALIPYRNTNKIEEVVKEATTIYFKAFGSALETVVEQVKTGVVKW